MNAHQPRHAAGTSTGALDRRLLMRGGVAAALAAGLAGVGVAAPAHAATHPLLRLGSRGTAVRELQRKLLAAGYEHMGVDGIYGPSTRGAVMALQRDHRLVVDGICGPNTWAVVDRLAGSGGGGGGDTATESSGSHPLLRSGSRGSAVTRLQRTMRANGYWHTGNDGVYGHTTAQAVMAVQKVHGLARDGVCGPNTWAVIDRLNRPRGRTTSGTVMEVDLARQVVIFVVSGRTRWVFNTSTGKSGWRTPRGRYRIFRQVNRMDYGPLGALWRPKYFNGGIAIHGSGSIPGYPASHGCARVSNAAMNYVWGSGLAPIGRRVWVY